MTEEPREQPPAQRTSDPGGIGPKAATTPAGSRPEVNYTGRWGEPGVPFFRMAGEPRKRADGSVVPPSKLALALGSLLVVVSIGMFIGLLDSFVGMFVPSIAFTGSPWAVPVMFSFIVIFLLVTLFFTVQQAWSRR